MQSKPAKKVLLGILIFSFFLNILNSNIPPEFHGDESKKISFIQNGTQDFKHPILMLQVVRSVNYFLGLTDPLSVAQLGRTISALCGVLSVYLIYLLAQRKMSGTYACLAALGVAVSPIMVVHAHYLKEDMIFTCSLLFALYSLMLFFDNPSKKTSLCLLGFAIGLVISAKYIGVLFFPILFLSPLLARSVNKKNLYKKLIVASCLSLATFLIINFPMMFHSSKAISSIIFEINHTIVGHAMFFQIPITVDVREYWFGFHFLFSIIPGITLLLALLAASFTITHLIQWNKTDLQDRITILTILFIYLSAEISPMKTFPDFMRYMIPIIPLLFYLILNGMSEMKVNKAILLRPVLLMFVIGLGYAGWQSGHLVYYFNKDTRHQSIAWASEQGGQVKGESYTKVARDIRSIDMLDIQKEKAEGVNYLMVSSFMYGRYEFASKLKYTPEEIKKINDVYQLLFQQPYVEIQPAYKSFAFSNPAIRIIDIRGLNEQEMLTLKQPEKSSAQTYPISFIRLP